MNLYRSSWYIRPGDNFVSNWNLTRMMEHDTYKIIKNLKRPYRHRNSTYFECKFKHTSYHCFHEVNQYRHKSIKLSVTWIGWLSCS